MLKKKKWDIPLNRYTTFSVCKILHSIADSLTLDAEDFCKNLVTSLTGGRLL